MADDNGQFSDDISALWGDQAESALVPPRPETPDEAFEGAEPAPTNGSQPAVVADPTDDSVARLAQALATHQTDVVSKAELQRTRSEMEGAFTHQLAVALYDLLGASNDRFGRTEQRLDDIGRRLEESVAGHVRNLTALIEAQQRVAVADQSAVQAQLEALRDVLSRPLASLDRIDDASAEGSVKLEGLSARVSSVQDDVAALRESVAELRRDLTGIRRRRRRRFGQWE